MSIWRERGRNESALFDVDQQSSHVQASHISVVLVARPHLPTALGRLPHLAASRRTPQLPHRQRDQLDNNGRHHRLGESDHLRFARRDASQLASNSLPPGCHSARQHHIRSASLARRIQRRDCQVSNERARGQLVARSIRHRLRQRLSQDAVHTHH